ncbi:hypothetical protein MM59RIKEN_13190 [Pusillibacter faecalis]|uniref:Uncharacterized protein n=1 Tax=Pusillibacter faecalis TaxID=2714358 RepID=A0A810Q792_9FIRM|nr:hypothetical protein MM59RIKEN_13190 [Pusillibacter faecalis]
MRAIKKDMGGPQEPRLRWKESRGDPGCRQGRRNAPARKERGIWRASRRKRPVFEEELRTFQNSPQA